MAELSQACVHLLSFAGASCVILPREDLRPDPVRLLVPPSLRSCEEEVGWRLELPLAKAKKTAICRASWSQAVPAAWLGMG